MSCTPRRTPLGLAQRDELTGLALLGRTLADLRGHRFTDAPGGGAPAPAAPPAPAEPPAEPAPKADDKPADPTAPLGDVPFDQLPKATQDEVRRLRELDKTHRSEKAAMQAQLEAGMTPAQRKELGKLLGYEKDDTPDVAALTETATTATTRAQALESSNADLTRANIVLLEAPDAGGNSRLLLDSKAFTDSIKGLDPADSGAIKTAIETWLTAHPEHKAAAGPAIPPSSAPQRQQGAGGGVAKPGLEGAISKAMSGQTP